MRDEFLQWLREQLDDDERIARAASSDTVVGSPGAWKPAPLGDEWEACRSDDGDEELLVALRPNLPRPPDVMSGYWGALFSHRPDAEPGVQSPMRAFEHAARHDPARVLAEVDAKRQILDELLPPPREPETDLELHARFAHPAYEYRTTEGPRKQWDDVDLPPCDDLGEPEPGWERNTDAGRNGWERFDYTEESYWRRRLPAGQERQARIPRSLWLLALPYADRPGYRDEWRP